MDETVEDIDEIARAATLTTCHIYLTGGKSFALPHSKLSEVFETQIPKINEKATCRLHEMLHRATF